jgi:tripartite-type tricarboxylate transporter receptor subunit TctC
MGTKERKRGGLGRRQVLKCAATLAAGAVASPFVGRIDSAFAAWPADRPVKIIVANTPGGPSDITARLIAPALQETLGGNFIVENRPGGGGNVGMQAAIRAEPDGYTLHLATSIWMLGPSLYDPQPFDPYKDLAPVVEVGASPTVFVVQSDSDAKTMKDLADWARKDQDKFNIATPPIGSMLHLGAALFKLRENLDKIAILPHSGGGQAVQAILGKNVQLCSSSLAPALPHIQAGTLRAISVLGEKRIPDLPNVPTAEEAGYQNFAFDTVVHLMATGKTPPEIIKRIEQAAITQLNTPALREKFNKAGFVVHARTAEQLAGRIAREVPMFKEIVEKANLKQKHG